jgi:hypothetical protein
LAACGQNVIGKANPRCFGSEGKNSQDAVFFQPARPRASPLRGSLPWRRRASRLLLRGQFLCMAFAQFTCRESLEGIEAFTQGRPFQELLRWRDSCIGSPESPYSDRIVLKVRSSLSTQGPRFRKSCGGISMFEPNATFPRNTDQPFAFNLGSRSILFKPSPAFTCSTLISSKYLSSTQHALGLAAASSSPLLPI